MSSSPAESVPGRGNAPDPRDYQAKAIEIEINLEFLDLASRAVFENGLGGCFCRMGCIWFERDLEVST